MKEPRSGPRICPRSPRTSRARLGPQAPTLQREPCRGRPRGPRGSLAAAQERLRRAIAERIAAESKRRRDERAVRSSRTSTRGLSTSTGSVPAGSSAVSPVPGAVIGALLRPVRNVVQVPHGPGFPGRVRHADWRGQVGCRALRRQLGDWAGNDVALRHADGMTTMSSDMSSIAVGSGQSVQAGQIIGYVGTVGPGLRRSFAFRALPGRGEVRRRLQCHQPPALAQRGRCQYLLGPADFLAGDSDHLIQWSSQDFALRYLSVMVLDV